MGNGQGFEINTAGVMAFGAQLKSDVEKDMAPTSERIKQILTWYPAFGTRSGSPAVQAAAVKYNAQLNAAMTFLDTLIHNAGVMAQAAQDVVVAYRKGDELSAADIQVVLGGASARVAGAAQAAEAARVRAEQEAAEAEELFMRRHGGPTR
ncbi:hypothetical protein Drose_04955 [Dactylosporangium roseum]|uniref:Uncharacterized protein n=1 Tax=Dactylosporangium roseum TaxID=47989 RepID=A0ABY5Z6I7_9ACTN|nr:hypothetical protein [Dactylosporangium roseum]UWZ37631.1 hypothetical protein Drose_04955 [Dactylosporangium roseum]